MQQGLVPTPPKFCFMRRQRLVAAAIVALLVAACGGGGSDEPVSVGEGLLDPTTSAPLTSAPASGSPAGDTTADSAAPPDEPSAAAPRSGPDNVSTHDDPSGFRLRLTVGDHVRFSTEAVIPLKLEYENRSNRVLVVETDPQLNFVIRDKSGTDRWRDADCRTAGVTGDDTPGYGVAPGERAETGSTYPYDERFGRRAGAFDTSKCKLPAGKYEVFGVIEWCAADRPTEAGPNAANTCAEGTTKLVFSAPVSIELVQT